MVKEKVKKPFYKKWWVWLIAIIIVLAVAAGGGDNDGAKPVSSGAGSEKKDNNKESEDVKDKEFGIGEKVELDNHVVEVTNVEKSSGSDFDKPKDGQEFVIVTVAIENGGDKEISYNPFNFKMKNSNGQIVDQAFTTVNSDTSLSSGELSPGGNVSGTIAFEQPKNDDALQLIFEPSFWKKSDIVFNLQ